MAKERTALRDLLALALRAVGGWAVCPNADCYAVMVATLADVARLPEPLRVLVANDVAVASIAEASHAGTADADGGRTVALECGFCNRERGRAGWDAPDGVPTATVGDAGVWAAYREAAATRADEARRRHNPLPPDALP